MKTSNLESNNIKKLNYPSFLEEDIGISKPDNALFHIIPIPYEKTVSYGGGTALGPSKILEASMQLELYDGYSNPSKKGIFTREPIFANDYKSLYSLTNKSISKVLELDKIPVILGGEHTVSVAVFESLKNTNKDFGVVQIDAHGDLRDEFENDKYSHACVMKRALDLDIDIFQIGIRSLSLPEVELRKAMSIKSLDAVDIYKKGIPKTILPPDFPKEIYLTIDVDGLDPSIIPATGTPEPGGLMWYETLEIIEKISKERKIIGFDVVELAPIKDLHHPEFTCARLIYQVMGLIEP